MIDNLEIWKRAVKTVKEMAKKHKTKTPVAPLDKNTVSWQKKNPWFGKNRARTAYALGLHSLLVEEHGVEFTKTKQYWHMIDAQMQKRFPAMRPRKPKITRQQLLKELLPGLNALFGHRYRYYNKKVKNKK